MLNNRRWHGKFYSCRIEGLSFTADPLLNFANLDLLFVAFQEASRPSPDMVAENKVLKEKLNSLETESLKYEKLLSQADEHFEQQLNKLRSQVGWVGWCVFHLSTL